MRLSHLAAFLPFAVAAVRAGTVGCPVFDADFNLYVLGLGQDYNFGTQDTWAKTATATPLTAAGRPPFDTTNPRCYLAQFFNAVYVLGADSKNPFSVYILDVKGGSWTQQTVDGTGGPDPTNQVEILDHDTNVFYAVSGNTIFFLNMNDQIAATSSALTWNNQITPSFIPTGYNPTISIAQNHVFFFGVPNAAAGDAFIFVIHFAFPQPTPQPFTALSGAAFPTTHGSAPSLFQANHVQEFIAFIPDDGSATYLIDVQHNTSLALPGPNDKGTGNLYTASETAVVQLSSAGDLAFLAIDQTNTKAATGWVDFSINVPTGGGAAPSGTGSGTSAAPSGTVAKGGPTASAPGPSSGSEPGAAAPSGTNPPNTAAARAGMSAALLLGATALVAVLAF